jgi:hypothetical protein
VKVYNDSLKLKAEEHCTRDGKDQFRRQEIDQIIQIIRWDGSSEEGRK